MLRLMEMKTKFKSKHNCLNPYYLFVVRYYSSEKPVEYQYLLCSTNFLALNSYDFETKIKIGYHDCTNERVNETRLLFAWDYCRKPEYDKKYVTFCSNEEEAKSLFEQWDEEKYAEKLEEEKERERKRESDTVYINGKRYRWWSTLGGLYDDNGWPPPTSDEHMAAYYDRKRKEALRKLDAKERALLKEVKNELQFNCIGGLHAFYILAEYYPEYLRIEREIERIKDPRRRW